ncbi:MAG: hypothetical protein IJL30_07425 [Clostridia bacterium]|nr:hypothetical protein [Clostridia bacterium]
MKIDRNLIFGTVALILTGVCGIFSLNGDIGSILLSALFYIIAAAAVLLIYSYLLPHFIGVNVDWLYYVPFPLMLIASRIILGWDLFMPFYAAGIIAITLDAYSKYKAKTLRGTLMIAGAGTASITLFALISLCGGVVL